MLPQSICLIDYLSILAFIAILYIFGNLFLAIIWKKEKSAIALGFYEKINFKIIVGICVIFFSLIILSIFRIPFLISFYFSFVMLFVIYFISNLNSLYKLNRQINLVRSLRNIKYEE